jgi:hypothetical protein
MIKRPAPSGKPPIPPDPAGKRLYSFHRKQPDGGSRTTLVGAELWATDAAAAMAYIKLTWGHTARQGWYCEDRSGDQEFRKAFGGHTR